MIGLKQTSLNTSNSQYINIKPTKKKTKTKTMINLKKKHKEIENLLKD